MRKQGRINKTFCACSALLLSGCAIAFDGPTANRGQSPIPSTDSQSDKSPSASSCYVISQRPAPIFFVGFPDQATADATFSLQVWVYQKTPGSLNDSVLPETFYSQVDVAAKTISVFGNVRRTDINPHQYNQCVYPAGGSLAMGAKVSVPVSAPAGVYEVQIPEEHYIEVKPVNPLGVHFPDAVATQSLTIQ